MVRLALHTFFISANASRKRLDPVILLGDWLAGRRIRELLLLHILCLWDALVLNHWSGSTASNGKNSEYD
jgi:hypothetical protein